MARDFVRASSQYLDNASAVVSVVPFTMACWFNADVTTQDLSLMNLNDGTGGDIGHILQAQGSTGGDPLVARTRTGAGAGVASTSTGFSAGTWHHACGVWAADDDRRAYLDGGSKGTNGTNRAPTPTRTDIGRKANGTDYMDGMIAEAAIWDVALADDEALMLGKGYSPFCVRPQSLVSFWRILGRFSPEVDFVGRFDLTVNGPTVVAHPRIFHAHKRVA